MLESLSLMLLKLLAGQCCFNITDLQCMKFIDSCSDGRPKALLVAVIADRLLNKSSEFQNRAWVNNKLSRNI